MAVTCFSSPCIPVKKPSLITKPVHKIMMLKQSHIPLKKAPTTLVRSSLRNKVFENRSEGIICYRDENGEMICEGFDEGPRFHQYLPRTPFQPRDAEIVNLLHQRLLQIVNGCELQHDNNGVVVLQEDFKWTDLNKFC
ncbi:hypothetical protein Tsubulata_026417 [Turnera subulata]|uniref:Uncharacterized protein n=1 Tax=Turnera subulata TaxID=218843 RepID=A0A9Q0J4T7_9ROSI|nr:hypothetical protein Tsubulata_026417 [Turnera subulata]